jgi:hypothetical protein
LYSTHHPWIKEEKEGDVECINEGSTRFNETLIQFAAI